MKHAIRIQTKPNAFARTAKVNIVVPKHIFVNINVAPKIVEFISVDLFIGRIISSDWFSLVCFISDNVDTGTGSIFSLFSSFKGKIAGDWRAVIGSWGGSFNESVIFIFYYFFIF